MSTSRKLGISKDFKAGPRGLPGLSLTYHGLGLGVLNDQDKAFMRQAVPVLAYGVSARLNAGEFISFSELADAITIGGKNEESAGQAEYNLRAARHLRRIHRTLSSPVQHWLYRQMFRAPMWMRALQPDFYSSWSPLSRLLRRDIHSHTPRHHLSPRGDKQP